VEWRASDEPEGESVLIPVECAEERRRVGRDAVRSSKMESVPRRLILKDPFNTFFRFSFFLSFFNSLFLYFFLSLSR